MYFKPLSDGFFDYLHSGLKTSFICESCVNPICSCSGGSRTRAVLLPGEENWMFRRFGVELPMVGEYLYGMCGDCTYLTKEKQCLAKHEKPFDCHAFPLCPEFDFKANRWMPRYASNCSYPAKIPIEWIREVWIGWELIAEAVEIDWLRYYNSIPDFDERLLQIK